MMRIVMIMMIGWGVYIFSDPSWAMMMMKSPFQIFVCGGEVDSKILANGEVYDPQVAIIIIIIIIIIVFIIIIIIIVTIHIIRSSSGRQLVPNREHDGASMRVWSRRCRRVSLCLRWMGQCQSPHCPLKPTWECPKIFSHWVLITLVWGCFAM